MSARQRGIGSLYTWQRCPPLRCASLALLAQLVEHFHGKEGVDGSSPSEGSLERPPNGGLSFSRWRYGMAQTGGVEAQWKRRVRILAAHARRSARTWRRGWSTWTRVATGGKSLPKRKP